MNERKKMSILRLCVIKTTHTERYQTRTGGKSFLCIQIPSLQCTERATTRISINSLQTKERAHIFLDTYEVFGGLWSNVRTKLESNTSKLFTSNFHIKIDCKCSGCVELTGCWGVSTGTSETYLGGWPSKQRWHGRMCAW